MALDTKTPPHYRKALNGEFRPAVNGLSMLDWARERYRNTLRLAREKRGADREGWLEDAEYWRRIIAALEAFAMHCQQCPQVLEQMRQIAGAPEPAQET